MSKAKKTKEGVSLSSLLRGNTGTLVLSILNDSPMHGYAISFEIGRRSKEMLQSKQGTLYPLLHELEKDGFITSEWEIPDGDRPRRVYTITDSGRKELERRLKAFQEFSSIMLQSAGANPNEQPG